MVKTTRNQLHYLSACEQCPRAQVLPDLTPSNPSQPCCWCIITGFADSTWDLAKTAEGIRCANVVLSSTSFYKLHQFLLMEKKRYHWTAFSSLNGRRNYNNNANSIECPHVRSVSPSLLCSVGVCSFLFSARPRHGVVTSTGGSLLVSLFCTSRRFSARPRHGVVTSTGGSLLVSLFCSSRHGVVTSTAQ